MHNQLDSQDIEELEQVNAELKESLAKCRALLRECRENLAANVNETDQQERKSAGHKG